jgi:hypothetical protein
MQAVNAITRENILLASALDAMLKVSEIALLGHEYAFDQLVLHCLSSL